MKKNKISIVTLITTVVIIFAFTNKINIKPTSYVTRYFNRSIGLTRGPINPGTQVLIAAEVKDPDNWVTTVYTSAAGAYLNGIYYMEEPGDVSDGIADGQYSKQEAINEVWNEYVRGSQYNLPGYVSSFTPPTSGASAITIQRDIAN